MGHDYLSNHGGKGANQAVAAARLGGNIVFIGKVGNDTLGESTIQLLKQEGIDVTYLTRTDKQPSGVAFITLDSNGENTIIVNPGANGLLSESDVNDAQNVFEEAKIVLMQLETPMPALIRAAELAKRHSAYVVLNPAPMTKKQLPSELLNHVDLLIPNETEAMAISGMKICDDYSASEVMRKIQSIGVKNVIITVGTKGVLANIDNSTVNIPAFKVKAVDTTAAGDTFCGALCVSLCNGTDLETAIRFANKASSISVTRMGAQLSMPYLEEMK
jgi:ribokinase